MRAILTFNLPRDHDEFYFATHGEDWHYIATELEVWLRDKIKYDNRDGFQEVRDELHNLMRDNNVGTEDVR